MLAKMKQEKKRWEKSTEAEGRTNCHKAKVWRWKETHPMREEGYQEISVDMDLLQGQITE